MIYKKQFYILKKQSERNGLPEDSGRPQRAAAFQGKPGYTAYTASKAAVDGMTKCLAQEWGRMGITVNSVWPSYMPGTMNRAQWGAEAGRSLPASALFSSLSFDYGRGFLGRKY